MANEKRLIDANALVMDLRRAEGFTRFGDKMFAIDIVNGQDTVDAVEVVHGRWMRHWNNYICDACNNYAWLKYNYCPHCGADMRERKDDA
jgi:hypothetical protein